MDLFFYFGRFKCFGCNYLIVCCSLGPVLVIWICYFGYFFINSRALFLIKKGEFCSFRARSVIRDNSCF